MRALFRLGRLTADEYDYLYAAVSSTAKGRSFLAEYLANNRPADVRKLADALERMENRLEELGKVLQPAKIAAILTNIAGKLSALDDSGTGRDETIDEPDAAAGSDIKEAIRELEQLSFAMTTLTEIFEEDDGQDSGDKISGDSNTKH